MLIHNTTNTWLANEAAKAMQKVTSQQSLTPQETLYLVLQAQTNHITHLDQTIHKDIQRSSEESNRRFEESNRRLEDMQRSIDKRFEDVNKRFEDVNKRFEDVNKRFEDMNKRFESMDKRFEAMDKRFEALQKSIDKRFRFTQRLIMLGFAALGALITIYRFFNFIP